MAMIYILAMLLGKLSAQLARTRKERGYSQRLFSAAQRFFCKNFQVIP
jgi:hypothetical protein